MYGLLIRHLMVIFVSTQVNNNLYGNYPMTFTYLCQ